MGYLSEVSSPIRIVIVRFDFLSLHPEQAALTGEMTEEMSRLMLLESGCVELSDPVEVHEL